MSSDWAKIANFQYRDKPCCKHGFSKITYDLTTNWNGGNENRATTDHFLILCVTDSISYYIFKWVAMQSPPWIAHGCSRGQHVCDRPSALTHHSSLRHSLLRSLLLNFLRQRSPAFDVPTGSLSRYLHLFSSWKSFDITTIRSWASSGADRSVQPFIAGTIVLTGDHRLHCT